MVRWALFVFLYIMGILATYSICDIDLDMPAWLSVLISLFWPLGIPVIGICMLIGGALF